MKGPPSAFQAADRGVRLSLPAPRILSSEVERFFYTERAVGSIPTGCTKNIMKKLLAVLAFATLTVSAQPFKHNLEIQCEKHDKVVNALQKDYKENIVWIGKNKELTYGVLLNNTTKTWTVILTDNTIACVIAEGTGFFFTNPI